MWRKEVKNMLNIIKRIHGDADWSSKWHNCYGSIKCKNEMKQTWVFKVIEFVTERRRHDGELDMDLLVFMIMMNQKVYLIIMVDNR